MIDYLVISKTIDSEHDELELGLGLSGLLNIGAYSHYLLA